MITKLTREELVKLNNALAAVGNLSGVKFAYAVAKNREELKPEIKSLQAANEPSEAFNILDAARVELAKEYAKKVDGKPVVEGDSYVMEDQALFDKAFDKLKAKHKDAVEAREKQMKDFEELLKEVVEIDLHTISPEYAPMR